MPSKRSAPQPGSVAGGAGLAGAACIGLGGSGPLTAGGEVHPAATAAQQAIMDRTNEDGDMWVIYVEVAIAVSLVLFIVWWTMRGKK